MEVIDYVINVIDKQIAMDRQEDEERYKQNLEFVGRERMVFSQEVTPMSMLSQVDGTFLNEVRVPANYYW